MPTPPFSYRDPYPLGDDGTEYRVDLSVELRTIGTLAGGFVL